MKSPKLLPWQYPTAWYGTSLCILLFLPTWKFGSPLWQLPRSDLLPFICLTLAFLVSASFSCILQITDGARSLWLSALVTTATFGVVFLGFIEVRTEFSRVIPVVVFAYAIVLVPAPYVIGASRKYWVLAFVMLFAAGLVVPFLPSSLPSSSPPQQQTSALIKTEYYNLDVETYLGLFPKSIEGGGIARIGDSYLRLSADGHLYFFGWKNEANRLTVTPLPYRVPINGDEFAVAAGHPWEYSPMNTTPESREAQSERPGLHTEWFRTYGLLVQEIGSRARLFVSHLYWKAAQECYVERVSMLEADRATILGGAADPKWRTLYETSPCLPIRGEGSRRGVAFIGFFGGGRMALLDPQTLLLTVGEFGFDGVHSAETPSQDPANSYGKTITVCEGQAFKRGRRHKLMPKRHQYCI